MAINDIIEIYRNRFGNNMGDVLFQQHVMLSVNEYSSWYIPNTQNKIDWIRSGAHYMGRITGIRIRDIRPEDDEINQEELNEVMKQLIQTQIVMSPDILWENMNDEQKQFMIKNFVQDYPAELIPVDRMGDENNAKSLLVLHSLWLGFGFEATDFLDLYE